MSGVPGTGTRRCLGCFWRSVKCILTGSMNAGWPVGMAVLVMILLGLTRLISRRFSLFFTLESWFHRRLKKTCSFRD
jgi:hypothetical protein